MAKGKVNMGQAQLPSATRWRGRRWRVAAISAVRGPSEASRRVSAVKEATMTERFRVPDCFTTASRGRSPQT